MTGIALRRHRLKLAGRGALVAGIAIYGCMRTSEGEAVVMLLHLLYGNLPSTHRVALFAIRSKLPLVDVSMAVLAALSHTREYRLYVTLGACNGRVHAPQGILGLVVIEFRYGADRPPRARRMAVLTRNIQISVRTMSAKCVLRQSA